MSFAANPKAPRDDTVIVEKPGEIASDSLAAESIQAGGDFGDGKAVADGVPAKSMTANTTDNTNATILPPTTDRAHRADEPVSLGGSGTEDSTGVTSESGETSAEEIMEGVMKPKGENLKEGGFDSEAPNASFNNEIGTKKDPGRLAERKFEAENASAGADAGYAGAHQSAEIGQGGFENLKEESA